MTMDDVAKYYGVSFETIKEISYMSLVVELMKP